MLKLSHVSKVYRAADVETTALRDISFDLDAGDFVALMGPSGCGKSTFLNILGTLDRPSTGRYWFGGSDITQLPSSNHLKIRKHSIGFIFQNFNLIDELTVFENVELALLYHEDVSARERRQRVSQALERMQVEHRAKHRPQQLSGGQQQRVAIARAVVKKPKLILADEPTGNLDSATGEEVMKLLRELNREGTSIVMVTHSRSQADHAHRLVTMLDGTFLQSQSLAPPGDNSSHRATDSGVPI